MRFIIPSATLIWITPIPDQIIEQAGRICYKSEELTTNDSARNFIKRVIKSGHESVLEHASASFRIITNRFTTHQIVRHRLFSYSQESQRYCNYSKGKFNEEITFVRPVDLGEGKKYSIWCQSMQNAENAYKEFIAAGGKAEQARSVLPSSCKTEIVMTGNFRSWKHFLSLRMDSHAQADVRFIANEINIELAKHSSVFKIR